MASTFLTLGRAYITENFYVSTMPSADRSALGRAYTRYPDGSAVNTAVALKKLGVRTCISAKVGDDNYGEVVSEYMSVSGIDPTCIRASGNGQTGICAVITENLGVSRRIIMEGANTDYDLDDVEYAIAQGADYVIINGDIPPECVNHAASLADDYGAKVLLSLCSEFASDVDLETMCPVEILVIDAMNAKRKTDIYPGDINTNLKVCSVLQSKIRAAYYVLKLNDGCCFVYSGKYYYYIPTYDMDSLDKTAAAEFFNAALLLKYLQKGDIKKACEFAVLGEFMVSQRLGGVGSLPTLKDMKKFVTDNQLDERIIN